MSISDIYKADQIRQILGKISDWSRPEWRQVVENVEDQSGARTSRIEIRAVPKEKRKMS